MLLNNVMKLRVNQGVTMHTFPQDLTNKLNALNQRMLKKGEIFLLAKAIADALPLMPPDEDSVKLFILNHKRMIDEVIYSLNNYSYLDEANIALVEKLVCDLTLWRANVAYSPLLTFYRSDPNVVIDDISNLPRYVDVTHMCAVGDMLDNANYMASLFRDFVTAVKSGIVTQSGSKTTVVVITE